MYSLIPVLLLVACHPRPTTSLIDRAELTPIEVRIIRSEPADTPLPLVTNEHPAEAGFLHAVSLPVHPDDAVIDHLLARMRATLELEEGVGIAAPQVGIGRRVVWVQRLDLEGEPLRAYRNPRIEEMGPEWELGWEGCLSVPAGFGQVERALSVTVSYDEPDGKRVHEEVTGWTARIFQHEVDHLDGILFLERREPGPLLSEEEYRAQKERERAAESEEAGGE